MSTAEGLPWAPIELPVKSPSADELLHRFDDVVLWVGRFRRDSRTKGGVARFAVDYRTIGGRSFGSNSVPARIRIESFGQLCALLGTTPEVRSLDEIIDQTSSTMPELVPWVHAHPLKAIDNGEVWSDLLAVVAWVKGVSTERLYLRQIDVEGIDTKFVDRHKRVLDELLTAVLPEGRNRHALHNGRFFPSLSFPSQTPNTRASVYSVLSRRCPRRAPNSRCARRSLRHWS